MWVVFVEIHWYCSHSVKALHRTRRIKIIITWDHSLLTLLLKAPKVTIHVPFRHTIRRSVTTAAYKGAKISNNVSQNFIFLFQHLYSNPLCLKKQKPCLYSQAWELIEYVVNALFSMFPTKKTAYLNLIWYLLTGNHNVTCYIGENKLGILLLSLDDLHLLKKIIW